MKRLIVALMVGGALFAAAFAAAATLGLSGGAVQVGDDSELRCDTDGVSVSYNIDYNGVVTSVQVNNIDAQCMGDRLIVVLKNGAGTMIGTGGAVDGGTGGAPIHPQPTTLFANLGNAPCSDVSCKVQIAPTNADGENTSGGHGVPGGNIAGVSVMIEGDNP